ncbi:MAG: motility protein A [Pseudobdellovibrio sp.]
MNISSVLGLLLAVVVFIAAAVTSTKDAKVFLDAHAVLIVVGGTISAALLSFSFTRLKSLFTIFLKKVLGSEKEFSAVVGEIVDLARGYRENNEYLKTKAPTIKHPFLKEAITLLADGGIEAHDLDEILSKRAKNSYLRFEEDAENFKALAKFPPAFGLLGAVIGMISLMQNLGGADAFTKVGPALAVALVATLYGIALANFIFLPLGENLTRINKKDLMVRKMICDGVKLIRAKKHPYMVEEACKSYLLPGERQKVGAKK